MSNHTVTGHCADRSSYSCHLQICGSLSKLIFAARRRVLLLLSKVTKCTFDTTHQKCIALSEGVCGSCGSLCHVCSLYRFCKTRHGRCLSFGTITAHCLRVSASIYLRLTASNLRIISGDGRCAGVCVSQCFALSAINRIVTRSCHKC